MDIILHTMQEQVEDKKVKNNLLFFSVPGMALIQSEINRPQVFTAKCSEPQADTIKVGVKEVM